MQVQKLLVIVLILNLLLLLLSSCGKKTTEPDPQTVAIPAFNIPGGSYSSVQSVSITSSTEGATIHYTTDGSNPSSNSAIYSGQINISSSITLKAKAVKSGWTDSSIASVTYTISIPQDVATPTFNPPEGSYPGAQSVSIICATSEATICYTTDDSEPTASSTVYSAPINISSSTTLKAKAFKPGWNDSNTASATYTIGTPKTVATPVFNPQGGTYYSTQSVFISCATSGATIRYTINGSDPTASSAVYNSSIIVSSSTTLKAKAFKSGWTQSSIASVAYTINAPQTVSTPIFNPPGGSYLAAQSVSISCATSGATIRYTTNGYDPTVSSAVYSSPISINSSTTLKAKAFKSGWTQSSTASATYAINAPQTVSTPVFNPSGGSYYAVQSVSISCATAGVTIVYTTDGNDPNSSSAVYSSPIKVSSNTTLKAKAFKYGWTDSKIASAAYSIIVPVATPIFDPLGGSYPSTRIVSISCETDGATIHYTINGSDPDTGSSVYDSPISVSSDITIKAKGFKIGWTPSMTASAHYSIVFIPGEMIYVPGGNFRMGQNIFWDYTDEMPIHSVSLDSFYLGKYEITQAMYTSTTGLNCPYGHGEGDNHPVYALDWFSVLGYCNLRSVNEGFTPVYTIGGSTDPADWASIPFGNPAWDAALCNWSANGYRLPTEAEWEYAARGATNYPDYYFSGSNNLDAVAWCSSNAGRISHPVGAKAPNALGFYDMSGNVSEWCWDWYGSNYYSSSPGYNPTGPANGGERAIRGGSWFHNFFGCRLTVRYKNYSTSIGADLGFRVCRTGL